MAEKVRVTGKTGLHADVVQDAQDVNRVAVSGQLVTAGGNPVDVDHPVPVTVTNAEVTLPATLVISSQDDFPSEGNTHSSIRLGDQDHEVTVTDANELRTSDSDTHDKLNTLHTDLGALTDTVNDGVDVSVTSSVLPSGAATEAKQDVGNSSLASIDTGVGATNTALATIDADLNAFAEQNTTDLGVLHADLGAVEAKQDTGNTSLASIDSKTSTVISGLAAIDSDVQAVDSDLNSFAAQNHSDLAVLHADLGTVEGKQDTGNTSLASIDTKLTSTNSKLDTLHADFGTVEGKQDTGNTSLASIDTKVATAANQASELTKLDTLHSDLVVVEGKQDTGNTSLASIDTKVATSTKQDTGNTSLASIDTKLTSTNTKLDTLHTDFGVVEGKQDTGNTSLASIDTKLTSTNTKLDTVHTDLTGGGGKLQTVDGSGNVQPSGDVAARKIFVQPTDGTNNQAYNASGEAKVTSTATSASVTAINGGGTKATYMATATFVAATLATDIFTITGSASKTIRILRIGVSATQTTSSEINLILLKRSTANSGGTSTTPTVVPLDSANAAATAVVRAYTANPTIGTLVGNVRNLKFVVPVILVGGNASAQSELELRFGEHAGQPVVLRGTGEVFAVNLNGVTVAGNSFSVWVEFTEE